MKCKLFLIAIIATLSATTSGCKTIDAYTGEEKTSNATKGGAIGAGIGAVIGYVSAKDKSSRDRRKAILIGAGVGGVTGAGVGVYMDKQESKLRTQLEGSGVSVTRNGEELILNMPGNITFATAESALKEDFDKVLDSVVLVLNEFDQTLIEVAGHTDSIGSEATNQQLSYNRARSVGNHLVNKGQINIDRVLIVGHGEVRPVGDNKTAEGREQNRRVELTLIPVKKEE
ncbi:MAG: OmpA family protein [Gammaproteobacteria bacterium]|nr:OmpA family protein [Gammaproteobacteria bacterium]